MRAALHGSTNRTNWKKQNTQRGSFSITIQESKHAQHTKRGRKGQNLCAFLFCVFIRKGKRNNNHKHKAGKERQCKRTTKDNQSKAGQKAEQTKENEDKEEENLEANTPQAFNPPNSTRVQRPHKPQKAPSQANPHNNPKPR